MFDFIVRFYLSIVTGFNCFGDVLFFTESSENMNFNQTSSYLIWGKVRDFMNFFGNIFNNSTSNFFPQLDNYVSISGTGIFFNPIHFWIGSVLGVIVCVGLFFILIKFLKWLFTLIPNALTGRI